MPRPAALGACCSLPHRPQHRRTGATLRPTCGRRAITRQPRWGRTSLKPSHQAPVLRRERRGHMPCFGWVASASREVLMPARPRQSRHSSPQAPRAPHPNPARRRRRTHAQPENAASEPRSVEMPSTEPPAASPHTWTPPEESHDQRVARLAQAIAALRSALRDVGASALALARGEVRAFSRRRIPTRRRGRVPNAPA